MAYKEVELDKNGAKALMDSWSDANEMIIKNGSAARRKKAAQQKAANPKATKKSSSRK